MRLTQKSIRCLRPADTLQNGATETCRRHGGYKLLNKVVIFVFFAYKKYSHSFEKLRLNHWWQMDYFDDVFHTFLGLDSVMYSAVNGTVTCLPVFIQNILNCVPKTNKAFTGLERHGGKWLMTTFSFWGGVTYSSNYFLTEKLERTLESKLELCNQRLLYIKYHDNPLLNINSSHALGQWFSTRGPSRIQMRPTMLNVTVWTQLKNNFQFYNSF